MKDDTFGYHPAVIPDDAAGRPRSPSELTAQLRRLLESPEERSRLAQLGRARAEGYRWERCARSGGKPPNS